MENQKNEELNLIKRFCTQKLAQILYDCVWADCLGRERAPLDWYTAEGFVNENSSVVNSIFRMIQDKMVQDLSYGTLDRLYGRFVWDNLYQPIKKSLQMRDKYTHICFH